MIQPRVSTSQEGFVLDTNHESHGSCCIQDVQVLNPPVFVNMPGEQSGKACKSLTVVFVFADASLENASSKNTTAVFPYGNTVENTEDLYS